MLFHLLHPTCIAFVPPHPPFLCSKTTKAMNNNKRANGSDAHKTFTTLSANPKRLRQTTLSWAPKPRIPPATQEASVPILSPPCFSAQKQRPIGEASAPSSPALTQREAHSDYTASSQSDSSSQGRSWGARDDDIPSSSSSQHRGGGVPFKERASGSSWRGRRRGGGHTYETSRAPAPRQFIFDVPDWCRPIRRVNMSSRRVVHKVCLQEIACRQLYVCSSGSYKAPQC